MTMFDASAWAGTWPFASGIATSLDDTLTSLTQAGITGAAISPLAAVLGPEPMTANRTLLDEVSGITAGELDVRVVPVLDASLPGWEADLDMLLSSYEGQIGAIRIVPNYHAYELEAPEAIALAKTVTDAGLGLCVQIRMLDERAHHPRMKVPATRLDSLARLAAAVPDGRFLACGVFQSELARLADAGNVSAELSSIESGDTLARALAVLGEDRLMLGTHAPIYYPAAAVAKVMPGSADPDTIIRVASFNAAAFFN